MKTIQMMVVLTVAIPENVKETDVCFRFDSPTAEKCIRQLGENRDLFLQTKKIDDLVLYDWELVKVERVVL